MEYPIFLKSEGFILAEKSKPQVPELPKEPPLPKLIKKNWFESLILPYEDFQDSQINTNRTDRYKGAYIEYVKQMEAYKKHIISLLSETSLKEFRKKGKNDTIGLSLDFYKTQEDILKGFSEKKFKAFLIEKFGDRIHADVEIHISPISRYFPDFVYKNEKTGLSIDIEIDEPYSIDSKQPIHYARVDNRRNRFFTKNGWFVIRFSEEQIVKHSNCCVKYLESIINHINDNEEVSNIVPKTPMWTYEEALEMARKDYRTTYLNYHLI